MPTISTSHLLRCATSTLTLWLVAFPQSYAGETQNGRPTIDDIQTAWLKRESSIRTAKVSWSEDRTDPKGSLSATLPKMVFKRNKLDPGRIMPAEDTTVKFTRQLWLDANNARLEYQGKSWVLETNDYQDQSYISIFTDKGQKQLRPLGPGRFKWPLGTVWEEQRVYKDANLMVLRPLILALRPCEPAMQPLALANTTISDRMLVIEERNCLELVEVRPDQSSFHLFLDPSRTFVVVRMLTVSHGQLREQMDLSYTHHPSVGWVPKGWSIVKNNQKGDLSTFITATVNDQEFNIPMDPKVFELEFPLGTAVADQTTKADYVIRMDGTKREIAQGEDTRLTYEEFLKDKPATGKTILVILGIAVVGLMALGAVLRWRRWRGLNRSS